MACDQVGVLDWLPQHFCSLAHEVFVTCAMEAVASDAMPHIQFIRQSVHEGMRRHGLMERGIKYSNLAG